MNQINPDDGQPPSLGLFFCDLRGADSYYVRNTSPFDSPTVVPAKTAHPSGFFRTRLKCGQLYMICTRIYKYTSSATSALVVWRFALLQGVTTMTTTPSTDDGVSPESEYPTTSDPALMYDDAILRAARGDGYVRTCGGTDGVFVDVLVAESGVIALELDDWLTIPVGGISEVTP